MKTEVASLLLAKYGKTNPPQINPGDTVKVHQKIKEGEKERTQLFEGLVIACKHGSGLDGTFTVRKIAVGGIGVEKVFPLHSPNIIKVERVKSAKVSRAKLYYMRYRKGKSARFKVEGSNGMSWDESVAEAAAKQAALDAENAETVEEVEVAMEGVGLVENEPEVPETEAAVEPEVVEEVPVDEVEAVEEVATEEAAEEVEDQEKV